MTRGVLSGADAPGLASNLRERTVSQLGAVGRTSTFIKGSFAPCKVATSSTDSPLKSSCDQGRDKSPSRGFDLAGVVLDLLRYIRRATPHGASAGAARFALIFTADSEQRCHHSKCK